MEASPVVSPPSPLRMQPPTRIIRARVLITLVRVAHHRPKRSGEPRTWLLTAAGPEPRPLSAVARAIATSGCGIHTCANWGFSPHFCFGTDSEPLGPGGGPGSAPSMLRDSQAPVCSQMSPDNPSNTVKCRQCLSLGLCRSVIGTRVPLQYRDLPGCQF